MEHCESQRMTAVALLSDSPVGTE